MFSCLWRIQNFFQGGSTIYSTYFQTEFFSGRTSLQHIENKKDPGGILPQKIFENLLTAVAILVLFEQFSGNFCLNFFVSNSKCFTQYGAFCSYIVDNAGLGRKVYCYRKGSKLWKNRIQQKHV